MKIHGACDPREQNAKNVTSGDKRDAQPRLEVVKRLNVAPLWLFGNI